MFANSNFSAPTPCYGFLSLLFSNVQTSTRERDSHMHACAFSPYPGMSDRPLPSHHICRLRVEACGNRLVRVFVCDCAPQYTMAIMSLICTHLYYKYIIDWHNIKTFSYLTRLLQTFEAKLRLGWLLGAFGNVPIKETQWRGLASARERKLSRSIGQDRK